MRGWADPLDRQLCSTLPLTLSNLMSTRPRRMSNRTSGSKLFFSNPPTMLIQKSPGPWLALPVTRTATVMTLFVKTLAVSPTLLSPAGNRALVTRSSKRLISKPMLSISNSISKKVIDSHLAEPNPKFSRMRPSLSLNIPETTLHLVTTLLVLVGSCARSRTRSPATAAKAPMPTRRNDSNTKKISWL